MKIVLLIGIMTGIIGGCKSFDVVDSPVTTDTGTASNNSNTKNINLQKTLVNKAGGSITFKSGQMIGYRNYPIGYTKGIDSNCFSWLYTDSTFSKPYDLGYPVKEVAIPENNKLKVLKVTSASNGSEFFDWNLDGNKGARASFNLYLKAQTNADKTIYIRFTCGLGLKEKTSKKVAEQKIIEIFDKGFNSIK